MSNELSLTAKISATKNSMTVVNATSTKTQTMQSTLTKLHHTNQAVGTSAEDLSTGDVTLTSQHVVLLYNRDPSNYVTVEVRKDATPTDTTIGIMRPGEPFGPVRLPAQSGGYPKLRLTANTAACDVEVIVCDAGDPAL